MLMGIAAYAEHRGVLVNAVQYAIGAGRIALTADNLIDSEEADRQWREDTTTQDRQAPKQILRPSSPNEPPLKHPTEPVPGMTYTQARALREVYDAQRRKLELQLRHGELVKRADVEKATHRLFRQLRDTAANIAPRLAGQLVGQTDEAVIFDLIDAEVRAVFDGFAGGKAA